MSDTNEATLPTAAEAAAVPPKPKKKEVPKVSIKMEDETIVEFPESQSVRKSVVEDAQETPIGVRFDFKSGATRTVLVADLPAAIVEYAACHGLLQKIGDEWSGAKDAAGQPASIEDIVLIADEIIGRLKSGDWNTQRAGGDSMAGASVVIQALVRVSKELDPNGVGKTSAEVKAFLDKKLEALKAEAKAAGNKEPTRQALYASYRKPGTKTAAAIAAIEAERATKNAVVDADDEVSRLMAAA